MKKPGSHLRTSHPVPGEHWRRSLSGSHPKVVSPWARSELPRAAISADESGSWAPTDALEHVEGGFKVPRRDEVLHGR